MTDSPITITTPAGKRAKQKVSVEVSVNIDGSEPDLVLVRIVMAQKETLIPLQKIWDDYCKSVVKQKTGHTINHI